MANYLLAWELGARSGHVVRLLPLAKSLLERGHSVAAAVRDMAVGSKAFRDIEIPVVEAPNHPIDRAIFQTPITHAHTMLNCGHYDREELHSLVKSWLAIYDTLRIDNVVCDHSPTAQLAAYVGGYGSVALGTGFEVPPPTSPLPNLRPNVANKSDVEQAENLLLDNLNAIAGSYGSPLLPSVGSLYHLSPPLLLTHPKIDPYGPRDSITYMTPPLPSWGTQPEWPVGEHPRIFAYLINHSYSVKVLETFARRNNSVIVVPDAGLAAATIRIGNPAVRLSREFVDPASVLEQCDLSVCFGQHGSIAASLMAGTPLLMIPYTLEQQLNAMKVRDAGAGLIVDLNDPDAFSFALNSLLANGANRLSDLTQGAMRFRDGWEGPAAPATIADHICQSCDV